MIEYSYNLSITYKKTNIYQVGRGQVQVRSASIEKPLLLKELVSLDFAMTMH